jgi:hypothetical protein
MSRTKIRFNDYSNIVIAKMDKTERKVLSKFGAYVMTASRRSMRSGGKKGKASRPGEPPRSHSANGLRRGHHAVQFGYDISSRSVIIGPEKMNHVVHNASGTIPEILEFGGTLSVFEERYLSSSSETPWFRVDLRYRNRKAWLRYTQENGGEGIAADRRGVRRQLRLRPIRIAARPYMAPAYTKTRSRLMPLWQNAMNAA